MVMTVEYQKTLCQGYYVGRTPMQTDLITMTKLRTNPKNAVKNRTLDCL